MQKSSAIDLADEAVLEAAGEVLRENPRAKMCDLTRGILLRLLRHEHLVQRREDFLRTSLGEMTRQGIFLTLLSAGIDVDGGARPMVAANSA